MLPLAAVLMLAGCIGSGASSGLAGDGPSAPGDPAAAHGDHAGHPAPPPAEHGVHPHHPAEHGAHVPGLSATAGPGYTVADVHFMQMMIGHHAQAILMSQLVADREAGPEVRALALRIDISQRDEIRMMEEWLRERGQPVPDEEQIRAMRMPGLVSAEDLARLAAARGPDFDRLFLELMIEHHLGAVSMVNDLFASPGGAQDPDLFRFATDVAADQLDEIGVMERILERLNPTLRSPR